MSTEMRQLPLYRVLGRMVAWQPPAGQFSEQRKREIDRLVDLLPSGSGVDNGTSIDLDRSKPDRIVLTCSFHHMNDVGMYDGWTDHEIIVTPSLGFEYEIRVTGRNRNEIKDYLSDLYREALREMVDEYAKAEQQVNA